MLLENLYGRDPQPGQSESQRGRSILDRLIKAGADDAEPELMDRVRDSIQEVERIEKLPASERNEELSGQGATRLRRAVQIMDLDIEELEDIVRTTKKS